MLASAVMLVYIAKCGKRSNAGKGSNAGKRSIAGKGSNAG